MGLINGKWIRIECDFRTKSIEFQQNKYYKCELEHHDTESTMKQLRKNIKNSGWQKINNKWACPFCIQQLQIDV